MDGVVAQRWLAMYTVMKQRLGQEQSRFHAAAPPGSQAKRPKGARSCHWIYGTIAAGTLGNPCFFSAKVRQDLKCNTFLSSMATQFILCQTAFPATYEHISPAADLSVEEVFGQCNATVQTTVTPIWTAYQDKCKEMQAETGWTAPYTSPSY